MKPAMSSRCEPDQRAGLAIEVISVKRCAVDIPGPEGHDNPIDTDEGPRGGLTMEKLG